MLMRRGWLGESLHYVIQNQNGFVKHKKYVSVYDKET